ncbi:Mad3/BUB1 homology region 1-domain-containing protein [Amylocystis lapponica]|nr:Mad3/BUB1 homology region 1-domain-containing protein [Amylocystis lapponica]
MDSSSLAQLNKKREQYRIQVATALQEDADPLAAYDTFVKWTLDNYPTNYFAQSGLLELLEEATRQFKDDAAYKGDLRYLRLWSLYASHVEDPTIIYAFLLSNEIGTVYAQTYQEYANALERNGRRADADAIYRKGVQRRARPVEPLKRRYDEFKGRSGAPLPQTNPSSLWNNAPPHTQSLRRNPLKHYPNVSSSSTPSVLPESSTSATSSALSKADISKHTHDRYAPMLAPPAPASALRSCYARSPCTLDGAPREEVGATAPERAMRTDFADGSRHTRTGRTMAEPTVTLATKEALADVFGMYNSPEKSMRFGIVPGSKHVPLRKIETFSAGPLINQLRKVSNENAGFPARTPGGGSFQPFVDETTKQSKNKSADPEQPPRLPTVTPSTSRRVLAVKDSAPLSAKPPTNENAPAPKAAPAFRPFSDEPKPVFSTVFTPLPPVQKDRPTASSDVFTAAIHKSENPPAEPPTVFHAIAPEPAKIVPFVDPQPVKVFSRPPPRSENARPPPSVFTPYVDSDAAASKPAPRAVLGERMPFRAFTPQPRPPPSPAINILDDDVSDEDESYVEYAEEGIEFAQAPPEEEDSMYDDGEDAPSRAPPLGGRLGQFGVMTPITERTLEYTSSTRAANTPNDAPALFVFRDADAVQAAEQLAAELRVEEDRSVAEFSEADERTGTLNLDDALAAASTFVPPNPCNPFDPPIMTTLLSLLPQDRDFHDMRHVEAGQLDALQKFAKKKSRRTSELADRRFAVVDKLGEGGFGAVFEAMDLDMLSRDVNDDDEDEDEDQEEKSKIALKVVKPRNLWEFHVLRSVHRTLPPNLRHSIVIPQALYAFRDESFLMLELCKQGTLLDIVNRAGSIGVTQQGACLDELLVMFFAVELMRLLEGLHRAGFIHGDVKIDNCLLRLEDVPGPPAAWIAMYDPAGGGGWRYKGIKMIDFGRTIDTRLFPASQRYIAEWPTDARDCLEMRAGHPWTYQTDYFGLAGIIFCMLYGKYIEAASVVPAEPAADGMQRYKLATPFKRYWQVDLWTRLFDVLLNPTLVRPDGQLPVCGELAGLRTEMETWLQANCNRASNTLKGLLKKIGIALLGGKDRSA